MPIELEIRLERFFAMNNAITLGTREGLLEAGKKIVDLASQLAPKDTEDLSKSGKAEMKDGKVFISFGNNLPDARAPAQEFGTAEMPAQPYLLPAVRNIDIVQEIATAIIKRLS